MCNREDDRDTLQPNERDRHLFSGRQEILDTVSQSMTKGRHNVGGGLPQQNGQKKVKVSMDVMQCGISGVYIVDRVSSSMYVS